MREKDPSTVKRCDFCDCRCKLDRQGFCTGCNRWPTKCTCIDYGLEKKYSRVDLLAESLILGSKDTKSRIKSFGEFEQEFFEGTESRIGVDKKFEVFITLFSYYHPRTRPVLWRVLITQAYLYNAIRNIRNIEHLKISNFDQLKETFDIEKTKSNCDWKQANEVVSGEEFNAPFQASENYLSHKQIVIWVPCSFFRKKFDRRSMI